MKKLALISTLFVATTAITSAGQLENLKASNAEQKRQISSLEAEIDNLYSLLEKEMRNNGKKPMSRGTSTQKLPVSLTGATYTVVKGDTISKIARQHGVSSSSIFTANRLKPTSIIRIGQKLTISGASQNLVVKKAPVSKPIAEAATLANLPEIPRVHVVQLPNAYTVKSGDTFYGIARKHSVSVNAMIKANPSLKPASLQVGQKVSIPSSATTTAKFSAPKIKTAVATTQKPTPVKKTPTVKIASAPKPKAAAKINTVSTHEEPEEMKSVTLSSPMTLQELANKYNTTVEAVNALNCWTYRPTIKLARGSEVYLPN